MSSTRSSTTKGLRRGRARAALLALCLLFGAPGAWAACTRLPGITDRNIDMDMGNVLISPTIPLGGLIASQLFSIPTKGSAEITTRCDTNGGTVNGTMEQGTPDPNFPNVYSTNVPGVGIRLSRKISSTQTVYYPHTLRFSSAYQFYFEVGTQFQVELIKTARITGNGPLAGGIYTRYYGDDGLSVLTTRLLGFGTTIITPSCIVDAGSRNIPVRFGKVPLTSFSARGSPAANYDQNFNITLNCGAGANMRNTVYLRMDATKDPSNEPGVLQITQGGTNVANGVGIQILDNNAATPVTFGDDALVGQSKDGAYVLPYTARYFQTGSQVTPGRADGTATFTLNYK